MACTRVPAGSGSFSGITSTTVARHREQWIAALRSFFLFLTATLLAACRDTAAQHRCAAPSTRTSRAFQPSSATLFPLSANAIRDSFSASNLSRPSAACW